MAKGREWQGEENDKGKRGEIMNTFLTKSVQLSYLPG